MNRKIRSDKIRKWRARKSRTARACASSERPMVTVYRSSKHIYAQIVDRETGKTIGTVSSRSPSIASQGGTGNVEAAKRVGQALAALAREKRVDEAVFNRNGFLYHGRVKALAEAAREAGLKL